MKKSAFMFFVFFVTGVLLSAHFASATLDEAKDMVLKAEAYYQANGKEKALREYNNPEGEFVKGDLYVFAYDLTGIVIAHPMNPKLVGMNTVDLPDVDGKLWRREALEKIDKDGTAIVEYKFKNPVSGKVEPKTTYLKKVGDIILGCGTYQ